MATISQRQALPDVQAAFHEDACNVTVYADGNLSGLSVTLPEGFYKALPESVNDDIRSIRVSGRDCWAMVFKDPYFGGWSASFPEGPLDVQDGKALIQDQEQHSEHPHADYNDAGDYEICDGKELTPPSSVAYTRLNGDPLAPQAHCSVG